MKLKVDSSELVVPFDRPHLYPKQEAALFHEKRWGIVEASTKSGKTLGCLAWLTEQAVVGEPGNNYWWVAPINLQADIAYRRLKRYLPLEWFTTNQTFRTIELANGAIIWFKSAEHPDSLYGEDVYAAVIDEATRCKADAWTAVRTTLTATGGPARIIGNVNGRKNWAYRLARRAEAGAPDMHYARLTVHDAIEAGIFSAEEAEDAKQHMTSAEYGELYEAIASGADDQFFHIEALGLVSDYPPHARVARAWDLAVTPATRGGDPDYTVGAKLAWDGTTIYVVDVVEQRDSPDKIVALVTRTAIADGPLCDQIFEEEKGASGAMMVEQFRRLLRDMPEAGRVFPGKLTGDKRARAFHLASRINDGNGLMVAGSWNDSFMDQLDAFPDTTHDDQVDAAAHAYTHLVPRTYRRGSVYLPGIS